MTRIGKPTFNTEIFTDDFKTDPWWWEWAPRPEPDRAMPLPGEVDVLIVGSGIAGLNCARITAAAGRDTLVVDAGPAGFGASNRLAGYIGRFLHYSIQKLESKVGKEKAHRLWKESGDAQWVLLDLIEKEQMDVGKLYRGRFTGACSPAHYDAMAANAEYINKNVPFEYSMCPASEQHKEVGTDYWRGGMILHEHGTLHPGLYHQGLMDATIRAGARIEGRTPVLNLAPEPSGGFTVTTRHYVIRARDVVICTNGYSNTQRSAVPWVRNRIVPVYAHQICTDTISGELMKDVKPSGRAVLDSKTNIFWDRPTPDDKRIIFGARTGHDDGNLRITAKKLRDLMVMVYPQLAETRISHVWRGVMGFSFDHLPHIGQTRDGVYFATGFCGSGLPLGTYFGQKVGHKLVGNPEGETEWWNHGFPTWPFYNGNPWWLPAYIHWTDFTDRMGSRGHIVRSG